MTRLDKAEVVIALNGIFIGSTHVNVGEALTSIAYLTHVILCP